LSIERVGYRVIRNVLSKELADHVNSELEFYKNLIKTHKDERQDEHEFDGLVNNSFWWYAPAATEVLLEKLTPLMEEVTKKKLYPSYSYYRIYYNGAVMPKHKDRPSCEYSMTLNFSNDPDPWAINITGLDGNDAGVLLEPGDAMVYKGMHCDHWRDEYTGNRMCQAFLHWVDADGPSASWKYDGRKYLGFPSAQ